MLSRSFFLVIFHGKSSGLPAVKQVLSAKQGECSGSAEKHWVAALFSGVSVTATDVRATANNHNQSREMSLQTEPCWQLYFGSLT